jgi:hypothetical protein
MAASLENLQHPSHSPDLAPSDFYIFWPFKNFLSGKMFKDQNALQRVLEMKQTGLPNSLLKLRNATFRESSRSTYIQNVASGYV